MSRPDCDVVGVAREIDPEYAVGVKAALKAGVEFVVARAAASPEEVAVVGEMRFDPTV